MLLPQIVEAPAFVSPKYIIKILFACLFFFFYSVNQADAALPCSVALDNREIVLELGSTEQATFLVYDSWGNPLIPAGATTPVVVIDPIESDCDAYIDFETWGPTGEKYHLYENVDGYFYTIEITIKKSLKFRFVYSGSHSVGGSMCEGAGGNIDSFFCPRTGRNIGPPDLFFLIDNDRVRVSAINMWGGTQSVKYIDEYIQDDGWIWPYHAQYICSSYCSGSPSESGMVLMPVSSSGSVPVAEQILVKEVTGAAPLSMAHNLIYSWNESWLQLRFREGGFMSVNGIVSIDNMALGAASSVSGWKGIQFNAGASGVLNGTTISGVKNAPGGYAVRVYNAELEVGNGTIINGLGGNGGIYASGSSADVLVSSGAILENHPSGYGLNVSNGAFAFVTGAATRIQVNASGGIRADAFGAVTIADGQILANIGPGAYASAGGSIVVRRGYSEPGRPVASGTRIEMLGNEGGGFRAETGGEVITCETSNDFADNGGTTPPYDVYAFEFSLVDAARSWWGDTLRAQIGTVDEEYSFIDIDPILTTAAGSNSTDVCGEAPKRDDGTASMDGPEALHSRITEAAQLRVAGRAAEAAERLAGALATAESEAEFGPLAGAATRLLAQADEAEAVLPLEVWASGAMRNAEAAPWAERLLLVHAVQRGTTADVERFGQSLLRRDGERAASHKLFAVRALVDRAVRDGREETARQWLATAATLDAAASTDLRRFVDVAFQREAAEPPRIAEVGSLKLDDEDALEAGVSADARIGIAPNPANTHVRVMVSDAAFASAEEAQITVFDALGRVVLTPASVGQAQSMLFDVGRLPVGTYTVRVSYTAADGTVATATTRFTVSR